MMLIHAKALAAAEVTRAGVSFPKSAEFTAEQLAADDWEPVPVEPEPPTPLEDCGCEPEVTKSKKK